MKKRKVRSIPTKSKAAIRPFIDDKNLRIAMIPNEKKNRIIGWDITLKRLKMSRKFMVRRGDITEAFQKMERWYERATSKTP